MSRLLLVPCQHCEYWHGGGVVVVVVVAVVGVEMAAEVMVVVKAGQDIDDNVGGDDDL